MGANPGTRVDAVAQMSNTEKLRRTIEYALSSPNLSAEFKQALSELLSPENLAIAAGVMVVWAASHFFGVGEVVDAILIGTAYVTLGLQAMQGLADLVEFGYDVINAESDFDLRRASEKLVRAIAALGAEVVLALLTRKAQIKLTGAKGSPVSRGSGPKSSAPPRTSEPVTGTQTRIASGVKEEPWPLLRGGQLDERQQGFLTKLAEGGGMMKIDKRTVSATDLAALTKHTGREHAVVILKDGSRALLDMGSYKGGTLPQSTKLLLMHSHPEDYGSGMAKFISPEDVDALKYLNQRYSYMVTADGTVYKFTQNTAPLSIGEVVREFHPMRGWINPKQ
jgi:hypothetical protein